MTIRLESGAILIDGAGDIALSGDCCCDACECTLPAPFAECQCLTADDATPTNLGDLTVTVSGTPTPQELYNGELYCPGAEECTSVNGTYVVSCGDDTTWCIASLACEDTDGYDWYYYTTIRIFYSGVSTPVITVVIRAGFLTYSPGSSNPYPSLTSSGCVSVLSNFPAIRTLTRTFTDEFSMWQYELGGTCTTACNNRVNRKACISSGSYAWDSDVYDAGGGEPFACDIDSLTVALSR